ncbi:MAG: ROK family protein [Acidimicrobiia bacterium]|jgi:fructokinase
MTLFGTVEIGGTKTDVAVGTSPHDLSKPHRIATTDPDRTLRAVLDFLAPYSLDGVGVASFGPLNLDPDSERFGTMLSTPKPGWSDFPVYETIAASLESPVSIDLDVNGAARGEGRWGAAQGMSHFAYVTIGTGIGAGVVVAGNPIAAEHHPEAGHVVVVRLEGDDFAGSCPYHGDCLEGMAAGPALEARFGRHETWAGNDLVVDLVAGYVAQGMRDLFYTTAPERIIIGGGVSNLPSFHERVRNHLGRQLANYPTEPDLDLLISPPGLGGLSGLAGGLALAADRVV